MYEVGQDEVVDAVARIAAELVTDAGKLTTLPVVGLKEIGYMFQVGWNTPYQWRSRKLLPPEDDLLSGNPVWRLQTIYAWAAATNRKIVWDPWGIHAPAELDRGDREAEPADASRPVTV